MLFMQYNKNLIFGSTLFVVGIVCFLYSSWGVLFFRNDDHANSIPSHAPEYTPLSTIKEATKNYSLELAQKAFDEGRFSSAAEMIEGKSGNLTEDEAILLSKAQEKIGEPENAINTITKNLTTPPSEKMLSQWMDLLLKEGKTSDATNTLQKFSESPSLHFYSLILALAAENYDEAKKQLLELKENKDYKPQYDAISSIFETYKSFSDGSPDFLNVMVANTLKSLEYERLALPILKKTLKENPDYRDAWIVMGSAYLSLHQFDVAESMFEKAISLDPTHPQSPYLLGLALSELHLYNDAIDQFDTALKNGYKPEEKVKRAKADVFMREGKYQEALRIYEDIINHGKNPTIADFSKAITLSIYQLNLPSKAMSFAQKGSELFPNNVSLMAQKAFATAENGDLASAKTTLESIRIQYPDNAEVLLYLGEIAKKNNEKEEAKTFFKACYEKGNGDAFSAECAVRYNKSE